MKLVDLASPSLFDACCSGDVIKEAQIGVAKAGAGDKERSSTRSCSKRYW